MSARIIERILSADALPSLPAVVVEALSLAQQDEISLNRIAQVIQQDPAMTSRLLRLANSPLFGQPRRISTTSQAIVVLGLRTVRVMLLSFTLIDAFQDDGEPFDYAGFWRRSVTGAVAGRLLAERTHRTAVEEAFISGLLSDIGILAAVRWAPDLYRSVLDAQKSTHKSVCEIEREHLGVTHEAIGAELLNHWGLPLSIKAAVATHHAPVGQCPPEHVRAEDLVTLVQSAAAVASFFEMNSDLSSMEMIRRSVTKRLGLSTLQFEEVLTLLGEQARAAAPLFSLRIGPLPDYQQIQQEMLTRMTPAVS